MAMPDTGPVPMATFTMTPATQNFGDVVMNDASDPVVFTVTNTGTGMSGMITSSLTGSGAGEFQIGASTCARLAPAATCTISVTFEPSAVRSASAQLVATDGTASAMSGLSGRGVMDVGLSISPNPYSFGTTQVGTPAAAHSFTVMNTGGAVSGTLAITLSGLDSTQFTTGMDTCSGMTLAAGASCTVQVTYAPTSAGDHSGSLQASASPGGTASAGLQGRAQIAAGLRIVPTTRNFGSVVVGTTSSSVDFTVTNTGDVATANLTSALSGAQAGEFTITASTCDGAPLAGHATCTVSVTFTPASAGAKAATLTVSGGGLMATSDLTATGLPVGAISVTPSTHDYGTSSVGAATGATTYTVTNTGGASIGPMVIAIAGANPADFPIVSGGDGCSGSTLAGGASCTVAVQFVPTAAGARAASLTANGSGASMPGSAALSGNGQTPSSIIITPAAADFGSVATDATSSLNFTVTNTGGASSGAITATLTGLQATQFSIGSLGACSAPLAGGASCTINVVFGPTSVGMKAAVLDVTAAAGGHDTSDIGGIGITPTALSLTPTLNLGNVAETESAQGSVLLSNSGAAAVTSLVITAPADAQFTLVPAAVNPCGATLAGMSSCNIGIRFTPSAQGAASSTLNVTATPGGALSSALSANGIADLLIAPSPDAFAYGSVIVGSTLPHTFTITNQTTTSHTLVLPVVTGADFTRTGGTCVAGALAAGASCTVIVTFAPTGAAGARTATLVASGSGGVTETVNLTGTAAGALRFRDWQVTAPAAGPVTVAFPAAFGDRAIGPVYEATLNVVNSGTVSTSTVTTSSTFTGDLNIVSDSCTGATLAAAGTCAIVVRFYPRTTGAVTGSVTVTYGPNSATAMITGNAIIGASVNVTGTTSFGTVVATQTANQTYTITNVSSSQATGNVGFSLVTATRYAIIAGGTCVAGMPLPASGSCTVIVRFSPSQVDTTTAAVTDILRVTQGAQTVDTALTGNVSSQISISPSTAAFATAVSTTSAATTFTVTNVGSATTGNLLFSVSGAPAAEFPITANTCTTLAASATCTFQAAFAPTANVDRSGVQIRVSNGAFVAGSARGTIATVSGDARSNANLVLSPNIGLFQFGDVAEGTNGTPFTFTLTNTGDQPSGVLSAMIVPAAVGTCSGFGGGNTTDFWDITSTTCIAALASGASCTVTIRHSPPPGSACMGAAFRTAQWRVTDGATTFTTTIGAWSNVTGAAFPSPSTEDYGAIVIGSSSTAHTVVVSNGAASTITITQAPATIGDFVVSASTCPVGTMIAAGGTCSFNLTFSPTSAGFRQNIMSINASGASGINMLYSANGTGLAAAAMSVTPGGAITYPTTVSGNTSPQTFTVTNTGGVAMSATAVPTIGGADPSQFTIGANTCTAALAAGASCTFDVSFAPSGAGARSAILTVTAGALSATRNLSGTGIAGALLGISPSVAQTCAASFAGTGASASVLCTTYTISNGGGSAATVSASVTNDFAVDPTSTCVTTPSLPVGGTCTVIVRHTPTDVAADAGVLTVSSPGVASVTGNISSSGIAALTATGTTTFGSAMVGNLATMQTFTFTNQTDPTTGILTYSIGGAAAADYDVMADSCSGATVARAATCAITVRFIPSATGTRTAALTVTDGTGNKTAVVNMSGTGT